MFVRVFYLNRERPCLYASVSVRVSASVCPGVPCGNAVVLSRSIRVCRCVCVCVCVLCVSPASVYRVFWSTNGICLSEYLGERKNHPSRNRTDWTLNKGIRVVPYTHARKDFIGGKI